MSLPRMNPCLPCMIGNPKRPRKNGDCSVHIDMPKAHAASGRARTYERNKNPYIGDGFSDGGLYVNPGERADRATVRKMAISAARLRRDGKITAATRIERRLDDICARRPDLEDAAQEGLEHGGLSDNPETVRSVAERYGGKCSRYGRGAILVRLPEYHARAFDRAVRMELGHVIVSGPRANEFIVAEFPTRNPDEGAGAHSPTRTEVRSPTRTSTEVRSPTSTEVRSPTSTTTSTEADTAGNITVTGGAGRGATTSVTVRGFGAPTRARKPSTAARALHGAALASHERATGVRGASASTTRDVGKLWGNPKYVHLYCPRCENELMPPDSADPGLCPSCGWTAKKTGEKPLARRVSTDNPKLMVLNPSSAIERSLAKKLRRSLTSAEKSLLARGCREFKTFHGREPTPADLVPVDVPPGTPLIVMGIGRVDRQNYTVPMESERRGKWTHKAGDQGGRRLTKAPWFAAIPGRSRHNTVIAQPRGAKSYFKPTHGLMG